MLIVLAGASGVGKTTLLPHLKGACPEVDWHDFDERWRGGGKAERQQVTDEWIRAALVTGRTLGLLGPCPLGEVLAAPSMPGTATVRHALLDVGDVERIGRLRTRGDGQDTQDVLNWSAWLRLHHHDPLWRPDVITQGSWPDMQWDRWLNGDRSEWPAPTLDVSGLSPVRSADLILRWLTR
ncbi:MULTISPECIES: hypothetical protein [unclassified Deinococcus]|uniref:hypothetical protein n=1 Tax=unclassified Deinococcus TaxID=2623546 RepID=UPI0006DC46C4|nr:MULTISPECIES: hypothetical protein [unclassified Deinococcus]MCD0162009.1 hypothetical protein [Deinococcus sp. 6YEL10]